MEIISRFTIHPTLNYWDLAPMLHFQNKPQCFLLFESFPPTGWYLKFHVFESQIYKGSNYPGKVKLYHLLTILWIKDKRNTFMEMMRTVMKVNHRWKDWILRTKEAGSTIGMHPFIMLSRISFPSTLQNQRHWIKEISSNFYYIFMIKQVLKMYESPVAGGKKMMR